MPSPLPAPQLLVPIHCRLAENPLWDERRGHLFWTDIEAGVLWRHVPTEGRTERIYTGPKVGGFTLEADGRLLLFRENDIAWLDPDRPAAGAVFWRAFQETGQKRFNDVTADPQGRVFAGTIGESATSGGVWRYDPDGHARQVITGTGCSNGMAFAADRRHFFWTCSTRGQIWRFPYAEASGELGEGVVWYQATEEEGTPDGLAIDEHDQVWSARWDGSRVREHGAGDGRVRRELFLPTPQVTSVAFGGPDGATLFITTAGGSGPEASETLAGALFSVVVPGVRGRPVLRSRLLG